MVGRNKCKEARKGTYEPLNALIIKKKKLKTNRKPIYNLKIIAFI